MYRSSITLSAERSPTLEGLTLPPRWCHICRLAPLTQQWSELKGTLSPPTATEPQQGPWRGLCVPPCPAAAGLRCPPNVPTARPEPSRTAAPPQIVTRRYVTAFNIPNAVQTLIALILITQLQSSKPVWGEIRREMSCRKKSDSGAVLK